MPQAAEALLLEAFSQAHLDRVINKIRILHF